MLPVLGLKRHVSYAFVVLSLISFGKSHAEAPTLNELEQAGAALEQSFAKMQSLAPSPYQNVCIPLLDIHEEITESFEQSPITEKQRTTVVSIFRDCYDSIHQELNLTAKEFKDLPTTSACLTQTKEFTAKLEGTEKVVNDLAATPLHPEENNQSAKVLAGMGALPISILGAEVMLNRMANCPLEN